MKTYTLPYFGEIELKPLEDYHDIDIEFKGKTISIDLNFEEETVSKKILDVTKSILERLEEFYKNAHDVIIENFSYGGGVVNYYVNRCIEDMDEEDLDAILENADKSLDKRNQVLSSIFLTRVGIYPHDSNRIIMDFTISTDIWDDLLVIWMFSNGEVDDIGIES
jgi:Protein of unknown function (DUF2004)